jgi:transcriptional regulator with XRE-family HTH domain
MQYNDNQEAGGISIRSPVMPPLPHLRAWRLHHGLTQDQLAERAGVQQSTVYRLEVLGLSAHRPTVRVLADALGTTVDDLLAGPPRGWRPTRRQRVRPTESDDNEMGPRP